MVKNKIRERLVKKGNARIRLKPKEKLLKYLVEHKEPVSIMQASGAIVVDYKNTYNYVGDLAASGAVVQKAIGNTNLIKLNISPNQEIFNVEQKRTEEFLSAHPSLKVVKSYIEEINYPFMIMLVFGSYVKGKKTKTSDIDICIISDNEAKTKKLLERLNLLSLKLEIHKFTTNEFISMIEKNQRNLGHEIVKSNIILYGTENYYNLVSKWMKKE